MKRSAVAVWKGKIKDGEGHLNTQSGILESTPYSFKSRFEEGSGTNPEELIAAAHAGCYAMKLSADLSKAGFEPSSLEVTAMVEIKDESISSSNLTLTAVVPGLEKEQFLEFAKRAKENCPVSKALNLSINLESHLK